MTNMRLALEWRYLRKKGDASAAFGWFVDYVVDGQSIFDRCVAPGGWHLTSALGWSPDRMSSGWHPATAVNETTARRLLLDAPPNTGDRVALFVCAQCADPACGRVTVRVERDAGEIVWRELADSGLGDVDGTWDHFPEEYADLGELRFEATAYQACIADLQRDPRTGP